MATLRRVMVTAVLLSTAGCSVADNLTYPEITGELDGIVTVQGEGLDRRIEYADRARVSMWYMRWSVFVPIRQLLGFTFGRTSMQDIENPSEHVRALVLALPDRAGSDLARASDSVARMLWIAELDPSPRNRIAALDGCCTLFEQLQLDAAEPLAAAVEPSPEPARLEAARAAVRAGRPAARRDGEFTPAVREAYLEALEILARGPLRQWPNRIALIGDLLQIWLHERTDAALREESRRALRQGLAQAVFGALIRAVEGRDARDAQVRLCAMQQLRRLGGTRAVPVMLALMAAPSSGAKTISDRFDQDSLVQLRLIHLCGQLRGKDATTAIRLAGREEWDALAPVDFLAQTVLTERSYYSKLRVPALTALSLSLGRSRLDYETAWVEEWYRERQRGS